MTDSKLSLIIVLWRKIDVSFPMDLVHFLEHSGVCALKINKELTVKTRFLFVAAERCETPGG